MSSESNPPFSAQCALRRCGGAKYTKQSSNTVNMCCIRFNGRQMLYKTRFDQLLVYSRAKHILRITNMCSRRKGRDIKSSHFSLHLSHDLQQRRRHWPSHVHYIYCCSAWLYHQKNLFPIAACWKDFSNIGVDVESCLTFVGNLPSCLWTCYVIKEGISEGFAFGSRSDLDENSSKGINSTLAVGKAWNAKAERWGMCHCTCHYVVLWEIEQ